MKKIVAGARFVMLTADSRLSSTTIERKRTYVNEVEKSFLQEEQGVLKSVDAILEEYMGKRKDADL